MRLSLLALVMGLAALVGAVSAEARPYYGYDRAERTHAKRSGDYRRASRNHSYRQYAERNDRHYARRTYAARPTYRRQYAQRRTYGTRTYASYGGGSLGGRPRAWCGWWMRTQLGGGPEYNLAANWRNYGHASGPRVGAVVVWSHHVGIITGQAANGQWIVKSGNDGNAVRERPQSVAGAVFRVG